MKSKYIVIVSLSVAVVALLGIYYWQTKQQAKAPVDATTAKENTQQASLGADIITKVQNPVEDQVPETNPVKDAYKNPFQ